MESAHPGEEAQAIAILIRQALETPEKRVAFITPDRGLAARVVAQLGRWGIAADDTAGQPLPQTAAGRVLLLLAEVLAESAAPVPLVALLTHPLVRAGEGRAEWLESARRLDLALRGPRPAPGLAPLREIAAKARIAEFWGRPRKCSRRCSIRGDRVPPICRWPSCSTCWQPPRKRCAARGCGPMPMAARWRRSSKSCAKPRATPPPGSIPPMATPCCAMRWSGSRCGRHGAGIPASRSTVCSKRGWPGRTWRSAAG